ncbi:MAG TPA: translation initiation factor IF-2 N-terminal domain-containing protein, partial [Sporosarcina sp.]|nr:translation initiation factor IF-2 N-terminal domain-containing protein [Sporosarcina sp.]
MTKIRVHEYAKQVNRTSKEVIEELGKINVNVTNHMSMLDKEATAKLDQRFGKGGSAPSDKSRNASRPAGNAQDKKQGNRPVQGGQRQGQSAQGGNRPAQGGQRQQSAQGGNRPAQGGQRQGQGAQGGNRPAQGG